MRKLQKVRICAQTICIYRKFVSLGLLFFTKIILKPLQTRLIEQLKQNVPANVSLADELATLLNVSVDSAYRRLRGDTALSIDEAAILCKQFNISIDSLLNTSQDLVTFNYKAFAKTESDLSVYINNILADLRKIQSLKNKEISFAAEDIPIFHHFEFKELTAFKFYYWQKAILLSKELQHNKFSVDLINPELIKNSREVYTLYRDIPSREIWTTETIYSSLKQIEFFYEAGHFNKKEDALLICVQVRKLIEGLQQKAESESKNEGFDKNFSLYCSDVMI